MNQSKVRDQRFWKLWQIAGAIGQCPRAINFLKRGKTSVSEEEWRRLLQMEGIDPSKACAVSCRWAETAPYRSGTKAMLVKYDLVVRDDGSVVLLDGCMGVDSMDIARFHREHGRKLIKQIGWLGYRGYLETEHHCKILS